MGKTHTGEGRCRHRGWYRQHGDGERKKRGEKDTNKGLSWGKMGPRKQRGKEEPLGSLPQPQWSGFSHVQQPLPGLPPCTQIVRDNQRALEGLEGIAHQVNEVLHNTEQVHRARGHLETEEHVKV